ncbi:hypothetical protein HDU89_002430 [Geranomyces variabilis]|nr:hypothetical protein HDU89_002430 [Geranomyces variabilis]
MQLPTPIDDDTIPSICEDFSYFKKTLQESRSLDDNATPRLNALTTRSPDVKESCMFFENALNSAYRDRERLIAGCLKISRDKIAQKRARLEADPANQDLRAAITVDESEQRAIASQFTVEEILRERTAAVFKSRCRGIATTKDLFLLQIRDAK